jgi:recombination protein U
MGRNGQFLAHYVKPAQVDFCGTMAGGRSVRFEAKQTSTDRFERKRLTDEQMDDLRDHQQLGALCFVLLCFGFDHFYRVPWKVWENMKTIYGRQYVTEKDVQQFRIPYTSGVIKILHGILNVNDMPDTKQLPDLCIACGQYADKGSEVCPNCQKEAQP